MDPLDAPMQLDAERLRAACRPLMARSGDIGFDVTVVESLGSSNAELMAEAFDEQPRVPRLLAVWRQTEGRGRRGRNWTSPPEVSLTFSVGFERFAGGPSLSGWSIAAGVAIARALHADVPDIALKWPNDLQRGGRKCVGILAETRRQPIGSTAIERVVTGIGLNVLPHATRDAQAGQPTVALFDGELPRPREDILAAVATSVWRRWVDFQQQGLAGSVADWRDFDALAGREVVVIDNGRTLMAGRAEGLREDGALGVRVGQTVNWVTVGDVSVRRVE